MNWRLRSAFTLLELIVSLLLLVILVGILLGTVAKHQQALRGMQEHILVSEQLRDGAQSMLADLRGTAISADTLRLLTDSAVELFSIIGSAVVCTAPNGQTLSLVPELLSSGNVLTTLPVLPDTGDIMSVYSAPDSITRERRWVRYRIQSVGSAPSSSICAAGSGFTSAGDAGLAARTVTILGMETGTVAAGAPVRFLRRGRYSLYRASDGEWYLGYKRCNAVTTGCSTIQPVSGPYLPYAPGGAGGLRIRYLDSLGQQLPSTRPLDVASFEVTFRAEVSVGGRIMGRTGDSTHFVVTPRNFR